MVSDQKKKKKISPKGINGENKCITIEERATRFKAGYIGECKSMADNRTYPRRGNIIVTCSVRLPVEYGRKVDIRTSSRVARS